MFYELSLERHVPAGHLLRAIDGFVALADLRVRLGHSIGRVGRPSTDPELVIRVLLIGYCFGIRAERRLREEVRLTWLIAGSVGLASMARYPFTRRSRRTGMGVFARLICFVVLTVLVAKGSVQCHYLLT